VVRAANIARQQPARQWTGWVVIMWNPNRHARNVRRAVFSVHGPCREGIRITVVQLERDSLVSCIT
jgi:hypothetical protein